MKTSIGLVIYGIPVDIAHKALLLGVEFFKHMDIPIEEYAYMINTDPDKDGETLHLVDATLEELQEKTKFDEATTFSLYNHELNTGSWSSRFGHSTCKHGGRFHHIDIQTVNRDETTFPKIKDFMENFSQKIHFEYAIFFERKGAFKAWQYGNAGGIKMFQNESISVFQRMSRTPAFESPDYFQDKIRMVYQTNIINKHHLSIDVAGESLEEWIKKDPNNGVLTKISDYHLFWDIEKLELQRMNDELGRAGVLLSWKELPTKPKRKLP